MLSRNISNKRGKVSQLNLLRYYQRLAEFGIGDTTKTALPLVAERLFTSPRHARNLLHQMQQLNWLEWQPRAGRNQRSDLTLHIALDELKSQLASQQLLQGKYDKALSILDHDQVAFGRLLQRTSGASMREGRLHIQLTYKRPFERLVPHQVHRSSERYLIRQIYSCLVTSDQHGHVQPDLAHHWDYDPKHYRWTFYLRPSLTFHDGSPITAETIVSLFAKLTQLDNYQIELAHLVNVSAPMANRVEFELSQPDLGFAGLISGVKYCIQPINQVNNTTHTAVTGSGPFQVYNHDHTKLELHAFERYYACRALTDQVSIWHWPEDNHVSQIETNQPEARHVPVDNCNYYIAPATQSDSHSSNIEQSKIEDGCMFLLFNQTATPKLSEEQRRYLSYRLSQQAIYQQLVKRSTLFECETAMNLLPQWHDITRPPAQQTNLPTELSIAVYNYSALVYCAHAVKSLLEQLGIRVSITVYSFRELSQHARQKTLDETLIVTNMNLDDNRHASAFSCLLDNPVLHYALGPQASQWLTDSLFNVRANHCLEDYLEALEPIASALINESWMIPMFHHRQTLRFQDVLNDVALTNWGWPDIKNVWSAGSR